MLDLLELAGAIGEGALLPTVGHELRAPLAAICGYLETLVDEELDPVTARRFLATAQREALHLRGLVDALLAVGIPAAERATSCDAVAQTRRVVEIVAPLARRRGITIRTRLPAAAIARIDGDAFIHALTNLLENALRHGSHGLVAITCAREERFVSVAVDDDGDGVPHDAIFQTGVRGANSREGCGIGLAVVKAIAERGGGDVRVERSTLGGARFVLRFEAG